MKPQDIQSQSELVEYYEELLDSLCNVDSTIVELIEIFNREEED